MATIPNVAVPSSQKKPAKKREIQFTEEMDEILKRITEIKNVAGVVVVNSEGITVKSTLDNVLSVQVAFLFLSLITAFLTFFAQSYLLIRFFNLFSSIPCWCHSFLKGQNRLFEI